MKQIEEEYYKSDEKTTQNPQGANAASAAPHDLYPPSPDQPIAMMKGVPGPVKDAMKSIVKSHGPKVHENPVFLPPSSPELSSQSTNVPIYQNALSL